MNTEDTPETEPLDNVIAMPPPALERAGRIVENNGRKAIHLLWELPADLSVARANLLLAKICSGAENGEREVAALGDKAVKEIVSRFSGPKGA